MDIYDVLRKLVEARGFQPHEQAEAIDIIEENRRLRAFGTTASQVREEHEHDWIHQGNGRSRCRICSLEEPQ